MVGRLASTTVWRGLNPTTNSSTPTFSIYGESPLTFHSVTAHAHLPKAFGAATKVNSEFPLWIGISTRYVALTRVFWRTVLKSTRARPCRKICPEPSRTTVNTRFKTGHQRRSPLLSRLSAILTTSGLPSSTPVSRKIAMSAKHSTNGIAAEVKDLVAVTVDFRKVPNPDFKVTVGVDGLSYYVIQYSVQMTCYSAYTKYELIYQDVNYGPVTAEYV